MRQKMIEIIFEKFDVSIQFIVACIKLLILNQTDMYPPILSYPLFLAPDPRGLHVKTGSPIYVCE